MNDTDHGIADHSGFWWLLLLAYFVGAATGVYTGWRAGLTEGQRVVRMGQ